MKAILALSLFFSCLVQAQTQTVLRRPSQVSTKAPFSPKPQVDDTSYLLNQGVEKLLVSIDYNSWFEKLVVKPASGAKQESQALFYGYGLNLEKNWYHGTWGWGVGGGLLTGRALGGDPAGTLQYFEPRVAWYAARVAPRIFYRWNSQADFGMDLIGMYKQCKWPDKTGDSIVTSGSDILAGVFFDVRLRFNHRLEAIQSFGFLYKDESTYWRLGLGYRL
jgi:hypothetical protein